MAKGFSKKNKRRSTGSFQKKKQLELVSSEPDLIGDLMNFLGKKPLKGELRNKLKSGTKHF